jgi:HSP20 family molecular chaperone IbpA
LDRKDVEIQLKEDALHIEARIDPAAHRPSEVRGDGALYTEYSVGHFGRSFSLSHVIDQQQQIFATLRLAARPAGLRGRAPFLIRGLAR